ncbi:hypothetical protein [Nocardia asiatica]|uniref:hypothetical protein n=1 Tax=Nocardia asiatica TaxID=209252 RepID=UPI0002E55210|nr:hypothetical protein [Nocardia asiatica]
MKDQDKIAAARDAVTRFLRGEIDPERHPQWFEDDILLFAVVRLDLQDPQWLLDQLGNGEFARELRAWLIPMMHKHGAEGQALLDGES